MFPGKFHLLRIAMLLAGTAASLLAGNFAPPAEGPIAFRRDRVPLDADTLARLSNQLTTLADAVDGSTPEARRGAAQMLALSVVLDPANTKARAIIGRFESGKHQPTVDPKKLRNCHARIWNYIGWLETDQAGPDGQALASCLKDVVAISDPKDPRAEALLAKGELGAWSGWIPEKAAYSEVTVAAIPPTGEDPADAPAAKPTVLLKKASVSVPLWKVIGKSTPPEWALDLAPLMMTAGTYPREKAADKPFSISIGKPSDHDPFASLTPVLLKLLLKQHGQLPAGCWVNVDSPELELQLPAGKRQSISAATAVLASAAVSGREPDASVIGVVDASGAFKLPTGFWDLLRSISSGNGRRLILPADAAKFLPSMLALENPQFFFDHEVLLAANFQQLLDLSAAAPDESLANSSGQFQQIREKGTGQPLGQYVANSFVRRRLADVAQAAPYHYSARMLAIQGAGSRPAFVTREVLVSELLRAIEPMAWLVSHGNSPFAPAEVESIGTTFETCRANVEHLNRYADTTDRGIVDRVLDMVTLIRPVDRAVRARPDPSVSGISGAQQSAYAALVKSHAEVMAALDPKPAVAAPAAEK